MPLSHYRRLLQRSSLTRTLVLLIALAWVLTGGQRWDVHSHDVDDDVAAYQASDHEHEHEHDHASPASDEGESGAAGDFVSHIHVVSGPTADAPSDSGPLLTSLPRVSWLFPRSVGDPPTSERTPPHRPPIG